MSPLSAVFFHGKITPFCPINRKFATAAPSEKAGLAAAVCTSVVLHLRWRKVFGVWRPPFYHVAFIFKVELLPFFLKALKEYGAEIEHFFNTLIFRSINFCVIWKRKKWHFNYSWILNFLCIFATFQFYQNKNWVPFLKLPTLIARKIYEAEKCSTFPHSVQCNVKMKQRLTLFFVNQTSLMFTLPAASSTTSTFFVMEKKNLFWGMTLFSLSFYDVR